MPPLFVSEFTEAFRFTRAPAIWGWRNVMPKFQYQQIEGLEDHCFVRIDDRYELSIIRTDEGIILDVWPIEDGEIWNNPCDSFQVFDHDTWTDHEIDKVAPEVPA